MVYSRSCGKRPGEHLHGVVHSLGDAERVGARQLADGDGDRRLAVELDGPVIGLGAKFDAGNVTTDAQDAAVLDLEDHVLELRHVRQAPHRVDGVLERLVGGRWRGADLTGGNLDVLLLDGLDHVVGGQVACSEAVRIEPDAHAVVLGAHHQGLGNPPGTRPSTSLMFRLM